MTKTELTDEQKKQLVDVVEQITFDLEPTKESILEFSKSINTMMPQLLEGTKKVVEATKRFSDEYEDILKYVDTSDWEKAADITFEEMEEMTIADVMERIRERHGIITPDSEWAINKYVKSEHPAIIIPQTNQPKNFIMAKDKVTNKLFEGGLMIGDENVLIATEGRKSKKELTAVVSIDFGELPNVQMSKSITGYDREVHDAIVSLYVDGENEYVTPLMIYRTMTGNPKAKITPKIEEEISDSVTKCSITRIYIDSTEEAEAYGMEKVRYEGNLLYTKKIVGTHKGQTSEWIQIIEKPVLYDYANDKGQVARVNIALLNTPISKNKETINLQGYLLRRISSMQGSKLSKNIVYETIYKHLEITASSNSALLNKQAKIRDKAKEILTYWKEQQFIKNFKENKKGKTIVSLSIEF